MLKIVQAFVGMGAVALLLSATSQANATTAPCSACGIIHGAPGPIAGAGLPVIAVGYGIYWLVRRRRTAE